MSLTGATYFARARTGIGQESYLVDIYDSSGGVSLRVATQDVQWSSTVFYPGILLNAPSIREEIDLLKCTSSVGNVTLEVANVMIGGTASPAAPRLLSDVLRNGTDAGRMFITWRVSIYSWLGPVVNDDLKLEIFRGRLMQVDPDGKGNLRLELEVKRPWDLVSVPQLKADSGRYFPLAYGGFAPSGSIPGAEEYGTYMSLFPVPVEVVTPAVVTALVGHSISASGRLHIYEEDTDSFVPLVDAADDFVDASEAYGDAYAMKADGLFRHGWKFKPVVTPDDPGDFTNPGNACDVPKADDPGTYAQETLSLDVAADDTASLYLAFPRAKFPFDGDYTVTVVYSATKTGGALTGQVTITTDQGGGGFDVMDFSGTNQTISQTFSQTQAPRYIEVVAYCYPSAGGAQTVDFRIKDVRIKATAQVDSTGDVQAQQTATKDEKILYCGARGQVKGWDTGNYADEVHEIHRDLLYRYAGLTGTPDGWTAIDTARQYWRARLWLLEPVELIEVLEQLQYEGGFVYHVRPNGTGNYIAAATSYSAGDVAATLDCQQDVEGLKVTHTHAKDLVTKYEVDYQRHPADEGRYIQHQTETGSARSDFDFGTTENIKAQALDYLVSTVNPIAADISGWTDYRELLAGDVKTQVACTVLNRRYWFLEVGDIVQFTNPRQHQDPFGNLATAYYMVVKTQRKPGELGLSLREVG